LRALRLASRWAARAGKGRPPKRLHGFKFTTEATSYGAVIVRGTRHGARHHWPRRRFEAKIVFLYRGP
jgi:hypothetical protein